ncbi:chemotaxis protein CheX [Aliiglaciecola sp. LCG003]|uniref:chemotaxis protein CheX n=1 Tax=Aliiglaciecola sp. LCG003 TaxID=3053655 RepID=UPI002573B8E7|nr:chemotaxis protein CheX [Aliiglaciecola sp. LCG003]WJG09780.1 chemotaxis protein CheX [Aliiglaciecola sp. LCG003]
MNVQFINPFIIALVNVLKTMAQTELKPGKPQKKSDPKAFGDVSGLIGMVGTDLKGSLSITFDESLALEIMHRMLGEKPDKINEEVADMVGEIANMVCGGAKMTLSEQGYDFGMATPVVVTGKNHTINHQVDGPRMILPFISDAGKAYLEICFDK